MAEPKQNRITRFAADLARLRSEVEGLASDIDAAKNANRGQIQGLQSQALQLELQLQRETERLTSLRAAAVERAALLKQTDDAAGRLTRRVEAAVELMLASLRTSIPYRLSERLAEVETIQSRLEDGSLVPRKAFAMLWQRIEDELRLTGESALDRQIVTVDDTDSLSDVIRIGTVMMLFKTPDGRTGKLTRTDNRWVYRLFDDPADLQRTDTLFERFKQRVRTGFFELPSALVAEVRL